MVIVVVWILFARGAGGQPPTQYTGGADYEEGTNVKKYGVEGQLGVGDSVCSRYRGLRWREGCGGREMGGIQMVIARRGAEGRRRALSRGIREPLLR